MKPNPTCAGECMYENFKLEYQVVHLEFIHNKYLNIEAICYNPFNQYDRESIFKHTITKFNSSDIKLKIALSIIDSIIKNLNLPEDKLYKLVIRDNKIFYIHS